MIEFFKQKESMKMLDNRSKSLFKALDCVLRKTRWYREQIRTFQESTLKSLVQFAYDNVPFYKNKYDSLGFHPSDVKSLEDLGRIPVVTKAELRKADKDSLKPVRDYLPSRLLSTSGSTGMPIQIFKSEEALWYFVAYEMVLFHNWCGGIPITSVLYFLSTAPHIIDYALADLLRTVVVEERFISTYERESTLREKLEEFLPSYISSYPATMRGLAVYLLERNLSYEEVKLIHLCSEVLDLHTKSLIRKVFPRAQIIETYSSTEGGLLGYECPSNGGFHLTEDSAIFEIVDENGLATEGTGRIIVTDLINWSTPIIRYSGLDDLCSWNNKKCSCVTCLRRIKQVDGKYLDSIYLKDGSTMSPYAFTNILVPVPSIYKYQIIQNAISEFEVLIVRDYSVDASNEEISSRIKREFAAVLREDVDCKISFVDDIRPREGAHKIPLVVSRVKRS